MLDLVVHQVAWLPSTDVKDAPKKVKAQDYILDEEGEESVMDGTMAVVVALGIRYYAFHDVPYPNHDDARLMVPDGPSQFQPHSNGWFHADTYEEIAATG